MDIFQLLAYFGGGMVIVSTMPQAIKTFKSKDVKNLSLGMFVLIFLAQLLWIIYGVHINDLPVILTNVLSAMIVVTNILLILKYRNVKS